MPKALLFMKKKAGLSDAEFKRHYETMHARLAEKYFGKFMADYRRNYIVRDGMPPSFEPATGLDFDVVTEIWYADQKNFDDMWATAILPDVAAAINADGDKFIVPGSFRVVVVDECERNRL